MTGKEVKKWADEFMFEAEDIPPNQDMEIYLLHCNNDPLGSIAWAAKAYKGEFVKSLAEITDDERRHYLAEIQKTALAMPLEAVTFGFRLSAVTRGFTHQMVRQRTAAYSQESTRFAVKSGVPVGLPPSLAGCNHESFQTVSMVYLEARKLFPNGTHEEWEEFARKHSTDQAKWYETWCETVEVIADAYNKLVDAGMPAEDARGLLPTNLLTQINYITNLRNFKAEAGKRLCTQAQFEWRLAWAKFAEAIRKYGKDQTYEVLMTQEQIDAINEHIYTKGLTGKTHMRQPGDKVSLDASWQFDAIADLFRPVCYYTGKCEFGAEFDRKCSIRERVEANHAINRPSTEWHTEADLGMPQMFDSRRHAFPWVKKDPNTNEPVAEIIPAIRPEEWLLDPGAAR
ncbi:ThyX-like thymidylate synthase [Nocardia phage P3.1]|nr:ThyX-like thymidylate synthase [Nocardia phage P3.1]